MKRYLISSAALLISLALALALYWPGIQGGTFHFDDFGNLSVIEKLDGVDSLSDLKAYLHSGDAGPTGRPISLLSFLLDTREWPTEAEPFLRTNTFLHGVNATLLFLICWQLLARAHHETLARKALPIAAITALIWLLHPYWVSTVLYPSQRMAMLSAFFALAGLALYLKGRALTLEPFQKTQGWILASIAVAGGTVMGVYSKENAAVLPVLILLVEWIGIRMLWAPPRSTRLEKTWFTLFLWLPTLALLFYLGSKANAYGFFELGNWRTFTLYERLLTQPGILFEYLRELLIPQIGYPGLYQENHEIARGLFSPPSTFLSILGLAAFAIMGLLLRRRLPLVSLAILFFLAGHLIESSVIMLELKFEHRNYLPAALLFLPIVAGIFMLKPYLRWGITAVLILMLGFFTYSYAVLWGKPVELAYYWSLRNPDSYRAQIMAASHFSRVGMGSVSFNLLEKAVGRNPESAALRITYASYLQQAGQEQAAQEQIQKAMKSIRHGTYDYHLSKLVDSLASAYVHGSSAALPRETLIELIQTFQERKEYWASAVNRRNFEYALARIDLKDQHPKQACQHLMNMQSHNGNLETDLIIASLLLENGYIADALYFTREAEAKIPSASDENMQFTQEWYAARTQELKETLESIHAEHPDRLPSFCPKPSAAH